MGVPLLSSMLGADPSGRWSRRLCIAIVGLSGLVFLVATIGVQIRRLPEHTDFASYYLAGTLARAHHSPYDAPAFAAAARAAGYTVEPFPFLYAPPFALAMQPLAHLSYPRARQVWMGWTALVLAAALVASARLLRLQASALGVLEPRARWLLLAVFVAAALDSTSVHNDVRSGSVGSLLLLALVLVAWALVQRRWVVLAVALAVAALVKVTPIVLLAWVWWRGERRAAGVAAGVLGAAVLAASAHWGWGIWGDYASHALWPILRAANGWAHNQSLDAFLVRLFDPGAMEAMPPRASTLERVVSLGLAAAITVLTWRVVALRRRSAGLLPVELGLVVLAVLMLMKITWVHTLTAMLFVWPVLMLAIVRAAEEGAPWAKRAGVAACAGFFLSSAHLPILWSTRFHHYPWLVLTGAHLAGLLLLWATCRAVLQRQPALGA